MRQFRTLFILHFFYVVTLFSTAYGVGEYGGVWSETLNFTHHTLKLRTGTEGNTVILSEDATSELPFDIDQIHRGLHTRVAELKIATGEHNVVVAGITLLLQLEDHYEAFFQVLKDEKGLPLAFVSGSKRTKGVSNKKYTFVHSSEDFDPMDLFQNFGDRLTQIRDPLLQPGEIGEYYQIWRKSLMAPLQRVQSEVRGLLEARFSSAHEFANAIEPKLQIACQDSDEGFGSSTDSEQYLLQFLRRGIPSIEAPTPRLIRECEKLRGTYVTQKMNFFKHRLFNTQDIDALIRGTEELKQNLLRFKNAREIGYILHLHSTREFCRCCAISLSQDLMRGALIEGVMNIVRARNGGGGIEPFFLVLGSCSSLMFNPTSEKEIYARQGIGKENTLPPTSYYSSTVLIEDVLKRRLFLQKLFSEHKDS